MLNINKKYNLNNFMMSRHVTSRHVNFYFKLFQKLCLYNNYKILFYLCIKKLFKLFFIGNFNCEKPKNNFIYIEKFNCKKIFATFGKYFNYLYHKFLFAKIICLFKFFYKYLSIENKGYKRLLSKIYSNLKSRRYYHAKFLL